MSLVMTLIVTAVATLVNTGLDRGYPSRWAHAELLAWPIAFAVLLVVGPRVQRLVERVTGSK
jgi:hypothetical protein